MMLNFVVLLLISLFHTSSSQSSDVVIASYNIWNIMFHWDIRKLYIAEMIQDVNADIIGFQEVRAEANLKYTQLDDLQKLLPEYKHKSYLPIEKIDKKSLRPGWEWEGVGFLSRHKILTVSSLNLSTPYHSPDKNRRLLFHVQFLLEDKQLEVNVVLVHFSYDRRAQCANAYDIIKYIYNIGVESVVIIGDFNTYEDFTTPIKALSNGRFEEDSVCEDIGDVFKQEQYLAHDYEFEDAWVHVNPNHPGYTFSNMPVPGFINRPDRILVSKVGIKISSALVLGKGNFYARKYGHKVYMDRFMKIWQAAKEGKLSPEQNSTCDMDCGPNGSCRCGICISGGDKNNCKPKECSECSLAKLSLFYLIILLMVPCLIYNQIFLLLFFLGIVKQKCRRYLVNKFKLRRFTNWTLMFSTLFIIFLLLLYLRFEFSDVLRLASLQMMEELNPSDHLMVVAKLNLI